MNCTITRSCSRSGPPIGWAFNLKIPTLCESYPDCVKSIQEEDDHVYTVLGTHLNTLYSDCVRNIHTVNGHGYMVPGTHWNTLLHCFQLVPGIYMCPELIVIWMNSCLNFALVNSQLVCRNFVIMYTTRWLNVGCFHSRLECCTICPMYKFMKLLVWNMQVLNVLSWQMCLFSCLQARGICLVMVMCCWECVVEDCRAGCDDGDGDGNDDVR